MKAYWPDDEFSNLDLRWGRRNEPGHSPHLLVDPHWSGEF